MVNNLDNEVWMPVKNFEGLYEVSNYGRVKALDRVWFTGMYKTIRSKEERLLSINKNRYGYSRVTLTKDGKYKGYTVHRLVGFSFIENKENKPCINHKNGIKTDNRLENLEWCTVSENTRHSYKNGLQVSKKKGEHSMARKIKCDTLGLYFNCILDACDTLDVGERSVHSVLKNKQIHVKGLTFKYV